MPVICQINIKEISGTIDIWDQVFSDVIMDDMPIRISIFAKERITVSTSVIGAIIYSMAKQSAPFFINISTSSATTLSKVCLALHDIISVYSNAKAQKRMILFGNPNELSISVYGNEHMMLCASTDGIQILTNTSNMSAGMAPVLSADYVQVNIGIAASTMISTILRSIQSMVSVNVDTGAMLKKELDGDIQNINISMSQISALVGWFTTVEDCANYTIDDLSTITASDLYFIIL